MSRQTTVDDPPQGVCVPGGLQELEVEAHLEPVRGEELHEPVMGQVCLGDEDSLPARGVGVFPGDGTPAALDLCQTGLVPHRIVDRLVEGATTGSGIDRHVRQAHVLDEGVRHVDAESVHPTIEPEPQDPVELGTYLLVVPVPVRLAGIEEVQVLLAGFPVRLDDALPGGSAEDRRPVVGWQLTVCAGAVTEDEPVTHGVARPTGQGLAKPRVL